MTSENKLKHLDFIQAVINRMASNSFLLKGWSVTLVAALFALSAKDTNSKYIVIAYLPVITFWLIDAYFLSQERSFISLYNDVSSKNDTDFSMNIKKFRKGRNGWVRSFFSGTLLLFYLSMVGVMLVVTYFIS